MLMKVHNLVASAKLDHNLQFVLQSSATNIDPKFSIALPQTEALVLGLLLQMTAGFLQC